MQFWKKIKEKFFLVKDQEDYVCIVFKYWDSYFFEKKLISPIDNCWVLVPVFVKLHLLGMIEEDINNVALRCQEEYGIITDKIRISYNVLTLAPVKPQNYYLAIVELSEKECESLEEFEAVHFTSILLKRDSNIFFEMVAKEML